MNGTPNEREELKKLLNVTRSQGKVKNQKEFASMVNLDPAYLSQLLSGTKPITRQMLKRIKDAVVTAGVVIEGNGNATATGPNSTAQVISADVSTLIAEFAEQRKVFVDQLKVKDEQISQLTGMLHEMISGKK